MHIGHIAGGTNAGWRKIRAAIKTDWDCPGCGARNRYFWTRCPNNCGHPRPEEQ